jgi:hypothetical protein
VEHSSPNRNNSGLLSSWRSFVGFVAMLVVSLFASSAAAHDANEITTRVYLQTNRLEVRLTIAASTARLMVQADGHDVADLDNAEEFGRARSLLAASAARLLQISADGKPLTPLETEVRRSVEDHLEFKVIYPRPAPGSLRLNAIRLNQLPSDQTYGALVTVVDVVNQVFLSQKLLNTADPIMDLKISGSALSEKKSR